MSNSTYILRITAGDITLYVADGVDNIHFTENASKASVFSDSLSDLSKYVLSEIELAPFVAGVLDEDDTSPTYQERGLEKIEIIYKTG